MAYLGGEPVGWCAVEPRPRFTGLVRNTRVPREGREEDRADETVWALTCLFTRAGFRRRGTTANALLEELHVGTVAAFAAAGFTELSRPTLRRAVMRIDF